MRELFIDKEFKPESMRLVGLISGILDEYLREGYRLTVRQVYYQLVQSNAVPNDRNSYNRVKELISDARLAGYLDWNAIEDRGRKPYEVTTWESPEHIIRAATERFKIDKWEDQPNHVEVMIEKDALSGIFLPVCEKWDVPFHANKGFSSSSALYHLGKKIQACNKHVYIIYAGDHDPSGVQMSQDLLDRLQMFSQSRITVMRIALTMKQIERYNPPPQFAKTQDTRTPAYVSRFGTDKCWELDSLKPRILAEMTEKAIISLMDMDKWQKAVEREDDMKDHLQNIVDSLSEK